MYDATDRLGVTFAKDAPSECIGARLIPELHIGNVTDTSIADADAIAEDDFLKRWIRVAGPERILAWASDHDPQIEWENMYAHRCQACIRLYTDSRVRKVIAEHHQEKLADILFAEWLLKRYEPEQKTDVNLAPCS